MYHCAQLDCFFSVDVYLGATSIILPGPDPAAILATIARERVTKLFCPPTVWISLLRHPDFDTTDLSQPAQGLLRRLGDAGGGAPRAAAAAARRAAVELLRPDRDGPAGHDPAPARAAAPGRLGRPGGAQRRDRCWSTTTAARCRPARSARSCTAARTPRWATTRTRRRPPRRSRGGWFHSGDLGVMTEDGYLSVVDRKKDMIKTGGENVASREIEEAIYELDGVAEVAVFGISHPHWIEAVTAVVVPEAGRDADRGGRRGARPGAARRLQAAEVRRPRRRAAEEPQRQDPQARAPRAARRPGELTPYAGRPAAVASARGDSMTTTSGRPRTAALAAALIASPGAGGGPGTGDDASADGQDRSLTLYTCVNDTTIQPVIEAFEKTGAGHGRALPRTHGRNSMPAWRPMPAAAACAPTSSGAGDQDDG